MKDLVLELIKELEANTTTLWVDSLEFTVECIVCESLEDVTEDVHNSEKMKQDNKFTGNRIFELIEQIKSNI